MRYRKIITAIVFIGILLTIPRGVRAQDTSIHTMQVSPDCTVTRQTYPRQSTTTIQPSSNGTIITVWTERGAQNPSWGNAEVKIWMDPRQPKWTMYDAYVTTWTSTNCSLNQMYTEYQRNPLPARSWNELCGAKITCAPASTSPTPTPSTGNGVCTALQVNPMPRGAHTVTQSNSGKMLTIWTDRGAQNPTWGKTEVKVWMAPGQPEWKLYDAGGTAVYSNTCSPNQMYERYKQDQKQEVTWNQLCAAGITCPSVSQTPTPTPTPSTSPSNTCRDMQPHKLMQGDHTIPAPGNGGAILTVWSGKQGVPWNSTEKKTYINPNENWKLYNAGGTLWTSNTCNASQVRETFKQVSFEEKSWQQLCDAKITCQ